MAKKNFCTKGKWTLPNKCLSTWKFMGINVIGISAFFHDSACCLIQDGRLVAAAEEERISRIKADPSLPGQAFRYCLEEASLTIRDIDCIAYYEDPAKKLARQQGSVMMVK